jgi:hypothetical protein
MAHYRRIRKPRCFLVYALAPPSLSPSEANDVFNSLVADLKLPLVVFHDHFIGQPGGIAIFYAETMDEREALFDQDHLDGWQVDYQPLIFSYSPAALDEQIAYTLRAYRDIDWKKLQRERPPSYGDPAREAETAIEE